MRLSVLSVIGLLGIMVAGLLGAEAAPPSHAKLEAVPFTKVQIQDEFWLQRLETNRKVVLPHNIKWCEDTGRISNFTKAAKRMEGKFEGIFFNDSDVYKVLEGAAYSLSLHPDKELEARIDGIIDQIAAAQQPDGYLNTYYTLVEPDKRWTDLPVKHELYCAGHLFEAAVAYYQATGKKKLLDVACRFADHIDNTFGPGKRMGYSGHEEIELALIKLYRVTGQERYRKLSEWFVAVRGNERDPKGEYRQAHLPVKEQSEIVGHAVRAMYLYSAVADIAALTGDQEYMNAMERLWRNVALRKMYITGGIGAQAHNEGFSADYDLGNDTAYAETCASIGMVLWNYRLLLLHGEGRFADVLERALYNGVLSGVSLQGDKFFYVNPLASRGRHHRQAWYGCACCPTNVVRILPSLGGYIYAQNNEGVFVNLYVASTAEMAVKDNSIKLIQETRYPWSGKVKIRVEPATAADFGVSLRIPGWCDAQTASVNGKPVTAVVEKSFIKIQRKWEQGDIIELDLPMVVRRVEANPKVRADIGRIALQRGPLVFCLEGVDHSGKVRNLALSRETPLTDRFDSKLLNGVVVIEGEALVTEYDDWTDKLYVSAPAARKVPLKAIPYYAWDHRAPGEMVVWIPEATGLAEMPQPMSKATGAKVTASHCHPEDTVEAANDRAIPTQSNDGSIPRFSWWPHKGTKEWIQYDFDRPTLLSSAEVYWWVDIPQGGCSLPKSWRILWKKGETWEPVKALSDYPLNKDDWCRVKFGPVPTMSLRLEVELEPEHSAGILEWQLP